MRKSMIFLGATVILAVLLLIVYGLSSVPRASFQPAKNGGGAAPEPLSQPTITFVNPSIGPMNAKVTLVVFGDYLCSSCSDLDASLKKLAQEMPSDLRVVWKDLPTKQASVQAALAARCAGAQGKFWEYHDLLMAEQSAINDTSLPLFAEQIGLDAARFKDCLDNEMAGPLVQRDYDEGVRLNIDAAPYMFIGERRISGALSMELLRSLVREEADRPTGAAPVPDAAAGQ